MKHRIAQKLTYANVVASIALFLALGGAAVAATALPKKSVGPKQLRPAAVRAIALARGAVTAPKLAPRSVTVGKLGPGAVTPGNLGNGSVTTDKIAAAAVIAASIKNGVITTNKLANNSVTAAKLGSDVAPLLGTLKSGQTLRGAFDLGQDTTVARQSVSFQFPLVNVPAAPEANILDAAATSPACPGLKGGNQQTPEAAAGQLCVYIKLKEGTLSTLGFAANGTSRLGFALSAVFGAASVNNRIQGYWAVTAP